jgi:pteridine reductase
MTKDMRPDAAGFGDRPLAIVTGAARRVGRAIALELARCGFDLLLTFHTREAEAAQTCREVRECRDDTGAAAACALAQVDLADAAALDRFAVRLASLPRIDAVVHNASSYQRTPLGTITHALAMHEMAVNAVAPLLLTQAAAPLLRRSRLHETADASGGKSGGASGGAVVCFSDIHALGRPRTDFTPYLMSKAALTALVSCLARELAPRVRINAIAPGVIAWPDDASVAEREAYEANIPLGRPGTPEDAARVVRWLILDATYITGEIIRLDGGRSLR